MLLHSSSMLLNFGCYVFLLELPALAAGQTDSDDFLLPPVWPAPSEPSSWYPTPMLSSSTQTTDVPTGTTSTTMASTTHELSYNLSFPTTSPALAWTLIGNQTVETSTTTTLVFAESPCIADGNIEDCVTYLNRHYMSYDPANPESQLGVTIRGRPRFRSKWFYCTQVCYRGQPDCYVAASILNHRVMLHPPSNTVAMPLNYTVGVVFQPDAVKYNLTKCAWQYDGAAFNRLNGGCGCGMPSHTCGSPGTAFANICPQTGQPADAQCPSVERCACDSGQTHYPHTCFWKGPAFNSSASPGVPRAATQNSPNQMRQMLAQRVSDQSGRTMDGIPLQGYWNEVTIDGKVLESMLSMNVSLAIAAFVYEKGNPQARRWAEQFNDQLNADYGQKAMIVGLDADMNITNGCVGPFVVPEARVGEREFLP